MHIKIKKSKKVLLQLYDDENVEKECLRLDLGYQKFEKICLKINEILSRHDYFLRMFELRKKFHYLLKSNLCKNVSSCITEKLNGFHIVSLKFGKKLRKNSDLSILSLNQ